MNFYLLLAEIAHEGPFNFMAELIQLLATLLVVLLLAFLTLYFVKRMNSKRQSGYNQGAAIKILEKRMLNNKASIYLIEVLGKGLVIAESASGIQLLTEFAQSGDMEEMVSAIKKEIKPAISLFPKRLKEILQTFMNRSPSE